MKLYNSLYPFKRYIVGPGSAEVTESVASGSSEGPVDGTTVVGANAPSTTRVEAGYIDDDLDKKIVMIRPQDTPIDTFTRSIANNEACKSWEAGGWEIGTREVVDQVDGAVLASATSIAVDNADMWKPGDTFIVHSINNGEDAGPLLDGSSNPVQCLIKSISSSTLTVQRVGTLSAALPAIPDNSFLYRLSPAVSELEASVEGFAIQPSDRKYYNQTHMCQVEESVIHALLKKKVASPSTRSRPSGTSSAAWSWRTCSASAVSPRTRRANSSTSPPASGGR